MSKKVKKQKSLEKLLDEALVPVDEQPYDLPKNWIWVKLGNIAEFINGDRGKNYPSRKDLISEGIPFINAGHIVDGKIDLKNINFISQEKYDSLSSGKVLINDIIYCLRGTLGKTAIVSNIEKGAIASSLVIIRANKRVNKTFLYYYLVSPLGKTMIKIHDNGSAQPNLSARNVKKYIVPLPPIYEQERIVRIIERIFKKIDKAKQFIDEVKQTFELRRLAIFDRAFRGHLTTDWRKQNTSNESPDKTEIRSEDFPFAIPKGWTWVYLGEISKIKGGKRLPKGEKLVDYKTPFPYIRVTDFKNYSVDLQNVKYINEDTAEKISKYTISNNDIYISIAGTIGKVGIIPEELNGANLTENAAKITEIKGADINYLMYLLSSHIVQEQIQKAVVSTTQPKLALFRIEKLRIPLPPLDEQKIISNKINMLLDKENELMKTMDILEICEQIKDSILSKVFRGEFGTNDQTEENAIQLLKEVLQEKTK